MEKILGGCFDWKVQKVKGAEIDFDGSVATEGMRSLRIVFDGKENVNFQHVYQVVSLKPESDYLLKISMKSKNVSTKSGVKVEILGVGPRFHAASEPLLGDTEWKELVIPFRTPPKSQGGVVRVRREKTNKFDRFISGTVWIDNVRLTERTPLSSLKK